MQLLTTPPISLVELSSVKGPVNLSSIPGIGQQRQVRIPTQT